MVMVMVTMKSDQGASLLQYAPPCTRSQEDDEGEVQAVQFSLAARTIAGAGVATLSRGANGDKHLSYAIIGDFLGASLSKVSRVAISTLSSATTTAFYLIILPAIEVIYSTYLLHRRTYINII